MSARRRRVVRGLGAGSALAAVGTAVLLSLPSDDRSARARASLPYPTDPVFIVHRPARLAQQPHLSRWAPVRQPALARMAPARSAPSVGRVRTRTPEGTRNVVQVLGRARRGPGGLWVQVRLPSGTRDRRGWLDRGALGGYGFVPTRLVVDRTRLRATLLRDGHPVFRTGVGIGTSSSPTPAGLFYIRNRLSRYRSPTYGPIAFGTSARSDVLTDWPAGGFIGIHGTDRPDLLPGRVSHGCIRMKNEAIRRLGRLMPVGTPVTIR